MRNELYLGSLSTRATEEDIRKLFSLVGTVTSIHLIKDTQTGKFMECGYVKMANAKEAKEAIDTLDGALLVDRVMSVSEARPHPGDRKRPFAGNRKPAPAKASASAREQRPPKGRK